MTEITINKINNQQILESSNSTSINEIDKNSGTSSEYSVSSNSYQIFESQKVTLSITREDATEEKDLYLVIQDPDEPSSGTSSGFDSYQIQRLQVNSSSVNVLNIGYLINFPAGIANVTLDVTANVDFANTASIEAERNFTVELYDSTGTFKARSVSIKIRNTLPLNDITPIISGSITTDATDIITVKLYKNVQLSGFQIASVDVPVGNTDWVINESDYTGSLGTYGDANTDGLLNLVLTATDPAGNESSPAILKVFLDTQDKKYGSGESPFDRELKSGDGPYLGSFNSISEKANYPEFISSTQPSLLIKNGSWGVKNYNNEIHNLGLFTLYNLEWANTSDPHPTNFEISDLTVIGTNKLNFNPDDGSETSFSDLSFTWDSNNIPDKKKQNLYLFVEDSARNYERFDGMAETSGSVDATLKYITVTTLDNTVALTPSSTTVEGLKYFDLTITLPTITPVLPNGTKFYIKKVSGDDVINFDGNTYIERTYNSSTDTATSIVITDIQALNTNGSIILGLYSKKQASDAPSDVLLVQSAQITVSEDTTAPTIVSVSKSWGTYLNATDDDIDKTITVEIETATLESGQSITATFTDTSSNTFSSSNTFAPSGSTNTDTVITISSSNLKSLDSGTVSIEISVSDLAGNTATNNDLSYTYDPDIPVINTIIPSWGDYLNADEDDNSGTITVSIDSIEDGQNVTLVLTDTSSTELYNQSVATSSNSSVFNFTASELQAFTEETITMTANVSDAAGNAAVTKTGTFIYDKTDPSLTIANSSWKDGDSYNLDKSEYESSSNSTINITTVGINDGIAVTLLFRDTSDNSTISTYTQNVSSDSVIFTLTPSQLQELPSEGTVFMAASSFDVAGNAASTSVTFNIDAVSPSVSNVSSTDGTYIIGDHIHITVQFSEIITVTGSPKLKLDIGSGKYATYDSNSGSNIEFSYDIVEGDVSSDLAYTGTDALEFNSATIQDSFGNNAILTLATPGAAKSLSNNNDIIIKGNKATITNVTSTVSDSTYIVGDLIPIRITFSETVVVTGSPKLKLETGSNDTYATYASGSNSSNLIFNYTVVSGDESSDLNYHSISALELNSGTIKDVPGNDVTLTLPGLTDSGSLGVNNNIVIDGILPEITNVSSTNGTYKIGDSISITVTFSKAVIVFGTPTLKLETGSNDTSATFASGSNSANLVFTYTVVEGDESVDLAYHSTDALELQGGTIVDSVGNTATIVLPTPGAANSLSDNNSIIIDGIRPHIDSVSVSSDNDFVDVTFNELVQSSTDSTLTASDFSISLSGGTATLPVISSVSVSSTVYTLGFTYTGAADGSETLTIAPASASSIFDLADNNAIVSQTNNTDSLNEQTPTPSAPTLKDVTNSGRLSDNITFSKEMKIQAELANTNSTVLFVFLKEPGQSSFTQILNQAVVGSTQYEIKLDLTSNLDGDYVLKIQTKESDKIFSKESGELTVTLDTGVPTYSSLLRTGGKSNTSIKLSFNENMALDNENDSLKNYMSNLNFVSNIKPANNKDIDGFCIVDNGSRLFLVCKGSSEIREYTTSTAYEFASVPTQNDNLDLVNSNYPTDWTNKLEGIALHSDGSRLYLLNSHNSDSDYRIVDKLPLNSGDTEWVLSSYSTDTGRKYDDQITQKAKGMTFDNGKIYIIYGEESTTGKRKIEQFTITTNTNTNFELTKDGTWDFDDINFLEVGSTSSAVKTIRGLSFNHDGSEIYFTSSGITSILAFKLSTAYDITDNSVKTYIGKYDFSVNSETEYARIADFQYYKNNNTEIFFTSHNYESYPSDGTSNIKKYEIDSKIKIYEKATDTLVHTIDVSSATSEASISSADITIQPDHTFDADTDYYITIGGKSFSDIAGNYYAGISDKTLEFTTALDTDALTSVTLDSSVDSGVQDDLITNVTEDLIFNLTSTNVERTFRVEITDPSSSTVEETFNNGGSNYTGTSHNITLNKTFTPDGDYHLHFYTTEINKGESLAFDLDLTIDATSPDAPDFNKVVLNNNTTDEYDTSQTSETTFFTASGLSVTQNSSDNITGFNINGTGSADILSQMVSILNGISSKTDFTNDEWWNELTNNWVLVDDSGIQYKILEHSGTKSDSNYIYLETAPKIGSFSEMTFICLNVDRHSS